MNVRTTSYTKGRGKLILQAGTYVIDGVLFLQIRVFTHKYMCKYLS